MNGSIRLGVHGWEPDQIRLVNEVDSDHPMHHPFSSRPKRWPLECRIPSQIRAPRFARTVTRASAAFRFLRARPLADRSPTWSHLAARAARNSFCADWGLFKAWEIRGARHADRVVVPRSPSAAFSSHLERDSLAGHVLRDLVVCRYQEQDLIFRHSITDDYRPWTAAADVSQFSLGMVVEPDSTFVVRQATGSIDIRLNTIRALDLCH